MGGVEVSFHSGIIQHNFEHNTLVSLVTPGSIILYFCEHNQISQLRGMELKDAVYIFIECWEGLGENKIIVVSNYQKVLVTK